MPEKMLTLTESFRTILRAGYPSRPAVADEIQSYRYFHSAPWCHCRLRRLDPEAQAADEAEAALKDGVMSESVRLRAILGDNRPDDIEPMEVAWNGIHIFDNTLKVYEGGRTLQTFRKVRCYAADIDVLIGVAGNGAAKVAPAKKLPIKHRVVFKAVEACFPEGLPDEINLPHPKLCDQLQKWLSKHHPKIKMVDKTILRALHRI
jgi:hypothetical protein